MNIWLARSASPTVFASRRTLYRPWPRVPSRRAACRSRGFATTPWRHEGDARIKELGREISDDYATVRDCYDSASDTPKNPIILSHGLLGFSELRLSNVLPPIEYWHGIKAALSAQGAEVITTSVPPSGSIEERAAKLGADIAAQVPQGTAVNIIAHSMGGLDARYMIANLRPAGVRVASLVTIATPHRGSAFADYLLEEGGKAPIHLPKLYWIIERAGLGTKAFGQLTRRYMAERFNPATQDEPGVRYFSYGALMDEPPLLSPFRQSFRVMSEEEGPNDGLVSVGSSRWGTYKGTLLNVSHLDLINWSNRMRWTVREWMGMKRNFNAIAFYLDIADMLAKEGL
ncbi:Lipase 2 [Paramyrothecium foliicola]|nr:Lipase 2 [Paramyrothecium foliicola]